MNPWLMVWKNLTRKPVRFVLTTASIVVAFFLFTILAGIGEALTAGIQSSNPNRIISSHKISITRSLPVNYANKIATVAGVESVSYASWFGGFYRNEQNQLATTAVHADNYFEMFPEYRLPAAVLREWKNTRTGMIIGERVAEKYGWKVGDVVPLQSSIWANRDESFTWEFVVSGIYSTDKLSTDTNQVFFQHRYFDEYRAYMGHSAAWFTSRVDSSADIDSVARAVDALFNNSTMETRTTSEQVFMKEQTRQLLDMSGLLQGVISAVFFTLLLIACNTLIQATRERMNEIAMMKALGFSSGRLIGASWAESLYLLATGAVMGTLLAVLCLGNVRTLFADFLPGIAIPPSHYLQVTVCVLLFSAVCTLVPAAKIKSLTISETLGDKH